jgi:hypothetical protein
MDENIKKQMIKGIDKKEYMRNYMKKYVENGENKICECGGKYKSYNFNLHCKTKKHKEFKYPNKDNKNILELINSLHELIKKFEN